MPGTECRWLGTLQIEDKVVSDGLEVGLPHGRVARSFAGGIPGHLLYLNDSAYFPKSKQENKQKWQNNSELHGRGAWSA